MTHELPAFTALDTRGLALEHDDVPAEAVTSGSPRTAVHELGSLGGVEVGVWEQTSGGMRDIEAEEIFVVVDGSATVTLFDEQDEPIRTVDLVAGVVCRLAAGSRTRWDVADRIRKVYVTPRETD